MIITKGQKLNDNHINYAQGILKVSFPGIEGLKCVLVQKRLKFDITSDVVQILHTRGDHWIVISNLQCEQGTIYDTVYSDVDEDTRKLVYDIFDSKVNISMFKHVQKQKGGMDCGAFSIAIATLLLYRAYPISLTQSVLRPHLITCFENHLFP